MPGAPEDTAFASEAIQSRAQFIETRRGRYTAQALQMFEEALEKVLKRKGFAEDPEVLEGIETAKRTFRRKLNALAADAIEIMNLAESDMRLNGFASQVADPLSADGRVLRQGASSR